MGEKELVRETDKYQHRNILGVIVRDESICTGTGGPSNMGRYLNQREFVKRPGYKNPNGGMRNPRTDNRRYKQQQHQPFPENRMPSGNGNGNNSSN